MKIVDYIAKSLWLPNHSPERYLLRDRARKVQFLSLFATCSLVYLGCHAVMQDLSRVTPAMLAGRFLGLTICAIVGRDITTMGYNLAQNVTSDQVWTPYIITNTIFKGTTVAGKLFSQMVEAHLEALLHPRKLREGCSFVNPFS